VGGAVLKVWDRGGRYGVGAALAKSWIDDSRLVVAAGRVLSLMEVQKPGGRRLPAAEFLRGSRRPGCNPRPRHPPREGKVDRGRPAARCMHRPLFFIAQYRGWFG